MINYPIADLRCRIMATLAYPSASVQLVAPAQPDVVTAANTSAPTKVVNVAAKDRIKFFVTPKANEQHIKVKKLIDIRSTQTEVKAANDGAK